MAVEEIRVRLRRKLEEIVGPEEASYLMDRPPGGWSDLVTNQSLADKLDTLRHDLRAEMTELRGEMRTEFAVFDAKLSALSASVDERLRRQTWVSTTTLISGLGLAFAIARFA